jgi:hypothetical protein
MLSYQLKHYLIKMFSVSNDGLSREQWIAVTAVGFGFGVVLLFFSGNKRM